MEYFYKYGTADTLTSDTLTADTLTADTLTAETLTADSLTADTLNAGTLTQEIFNFPARRQMGSEIQDDAHFTATRLVRAGIS